MKYSVFVSGPYTNGDTETNVKNATEVANSLIDMGCLPLVPHLWHYIEVNHPKRYETWLNLALSLLKKADIYLRLDGQSSGADVEESYAKELNIPRFYTIEKLKEYIEKNGSV
jgi:hypothetical protein